jgi:nicotinate-nucleotide adenylyltransferase
VTASTGGVGVLGGAFNPPHIAHLLLAGEAIDSLGLDELILVPTGEAPHKRISPEPGPRVRLEMARLAAEDATGLTVSELEVDRGGPSFAFRTLELLADERPGSQLTFVMGADVAAGLEGWRNPERVLELARVAIAERPGFDRSEADEALARLGAAERAASIEMPAVGVSSSMVRARVAAGRTIRWLVPEPVEGLIRERGLYGAAGAAVPR